jgi:hypothetical protein
MLMYALKTSAMILAIDGDGRARSRGSAVSVVDSMAAG